ncbi:hypothetical protein Poli38472_002914 [Pythium oligandrum]|uniref:Serine carboxypeptidase n=1 Tax=Pythium oligandrum TaxID=41045 RepID=A0A8K1C5T4_PYTOL|nr:hypothetical protein Poli38472_002914 [Pythium oligandrum]|eukprot:TMW56989.1 hypothetical protein Poli38472_002914 [Pythium oligandrum]
MSEQAPLLKSQQERQPRGRRGLLVGLAAVVSALVGIGIYTAATAKSVIYCDTTKQEAGYIKLPNKVDDHYFYCYFESRSNPATDPFVIWLTGGPGASALYIVEQNAKHSNSSSDDVIHINLEGVAMGNPWTSPVIQVEHTKDVAKLLQETYNITLVSESQMDKISSRTNTCVELFSECQVNPKNASTCDDATDCREELMQSLAGPNRSQFDLREECAEFVEGMCSNTESLRYFKQYLNLDHNLAYVDGISDPSDKKDKVRTEFFMNFQCTSSEEALKKAEKEAKRAKKNKKTSQATPQPSEEYGVATPDTEKPSGSSNGSAGTVKNPLDKTDTSGVGGLSAMYSTAMAAWVAPTVILVLML